MSLTMVEQAIKKKNVIYVYNVYLNSKDLLLTFNIYMRLMLVVDDSFSDYRDRLSPSHQQLSQKLKFWSWPLVNANSIVQNKERSFVSHWRQKKFFSG